MFGKILMSLAFLTVVAPVAAEAKCEGTSPPLHFQNDDAVFVLTSDKDGCGFSGNAGGSVMLKSLDLIRPAKHGVVGRIGQFGFGYRPNPKYQGPDDFKMKICGNNLFGDGCSFQTVNVTVVP